MPMYTTIPPAVTHSQVPRLRPAGMRGLGQLDIFSSTDISDWGWMEYVVIAAVVWFGWSLLKGAKSTARSVSGAVRKRRRRRQQKALALA
jgi:hypothetical protein